MTPIFHPNLINKPFEDPGVFVDFLFNSRAILFDLGTLSSFSTRKLLRTTHAFVSHTHIDHFIGFDHLLRIFLGRDKRLHLYGPPGFVNQVSSRLAAYSWNLVYSYDTDFTLIATEIHPDGGGLSCEFHCLRGFKAEHVKTCRFNGQIIHDEERLLVRAVHLDHKITSLAFSLVEKWHVNIMKNRLNEMGLSVGPWLNELKAAILREEPDETPICTLRLDEIKTGTATLPLGELKEQAVRIVAGQKICYVTDAGFTPENAEKIIDLARGSDYLFIEASFLEEEAERAAERHHLTARQAGELARAAGAARVIPFHFSPRYMDREQEIRDELERAWKSV